MSDNGRSMTNTPTILTVIVPIVLPDDSVALRSALAYWVKRLNELPNTRCVFSTNGIAQPTDVTLLRDAALKYNRFSWIDLAETSRSKATNLNIAIEEAKTPVCGVFDVDARPSRRSLLLAPRILSRSNEIRALQGPKLIAPPKPGGSRVINSICRLESLLCTYLARDRSSAKTSLTHFVGSNGYFSTKLLRQFSFSTEAVAEDLELSAHCYINNVAIHYDESLLCYEDAPTSLHELILQRRRWVHGWLQVFSSSGVELMFRLHDRKAEKMWRKAWLWPLVPLICTTASITAVAILQLDYAFILLLIGFYISCGAMVAAMAEHAIRTLRYDKEDSIRYEAVDGIALRSLSPLDLAVTFLSPMYILWVFVITVTVIVVPPHTRYTVRKLPGEWLLDNQPAHSH